MKQDLNKENLKQYLQNYILKWEEMIKFENDFPSDNKEWRSEFLTELKVKIDTFQYFIDKGIDNEFK